MLADWGKFITGIITIKKTTKDKYLLPGFKILAKQLFKMHNKFISK